MWQSADPILDQYLSGKVNEGVYNPLNLSLYSYTYNNPLVYVDPDGNVNVFIGGAADSAKRGSPINSSVPFLKTGNPARLQSPNNVPDIVLPGSATSYTEIEDEFGDTVSGPSKAASMIKQIKKKYPNEPVNLIGHSWGGADAMSLENELTLEEGINVDLVVTIDAVSRGISRRKPEGENTKWLNRYILDSARVPGLNADTVAKIGGPWGHQDKADANVPVTNWPGKGKGETGHMGILKMPLKKDLNGL